MGDLKDENRTRVTQKTVAERTWYMKPGSMVVSVSRTRSRTRPVWTPRPRRPRGSRRRRQSNLPKCHLLYSFPPHYCSVGLSLFTSVVCWVQFGVFVHLNDVGPNIVESIIELSVFGFKAFALNTLLKLALFFHFF